MMVNVLLMAGGHGERLWPLSQTCSPKQCLPVVQGKSFIRATINRLEGIISPDQIFVATGRETAEPVMKEVPDLPEENIIVEPYPRDTAPCIGLAAAIIEEASPESIMIALPCDHIIQDIPLFQQCIEKAIVAATHGYLVTLGITPQYPATEYGYLECGKESTELKKATGDDYIVVDRFVEKPDRIAAQQFIDSGSFLWNSGMFVWRCERIIEEISVHMPHLKSGLDNIMKAYGTDRYEEILDKEFYQFPRQSIDRGVMEKQHGIIAVKADFSWRDSGNWQSFAELLPKNSSNNCVHGRFTALDTSGCIVWSDKTVAALGVNDLVIVSANDAILVCAKDRAQDIKELLEQLQTETCDPGES